METTRKFREALEALKGRRKPALKAVSELRRVLLNTDTPQKADGSNSSWIQELLAQYDRDSLQELVDLIQSELDAVDLQSGSVNSIPDESREMYHRRCLHALRYLSTRHQVLPSSLILQNVKPDGNRPVAGGGFADIWRGTIGSQHVCLKVLRLVLEPDKDVRENIRKQFCNEAVLWRQLKHPNILPLLGVNIKLFDPSFCLITPWMENGDIISYSKQNTTHNRHTALLEIAAGLSYLHSRNPPITHGDIRGANILVTDDAHCCLADFGLAIITVGSQSLSTATTGNMKGSLRWMAPELIHVDGQVEEASLNNPSRDIYAFGCTVIEILTLQYPFHNIKTDYGVLASLMSGARPDRPQNAWCTNAIWDLTSRCWAQHASARPKAHEVYISLEQSFQGHPSSTPPPQAPMNIQPPVDMKDSQGIIGTRLL